MKSVQAPPSLYRRWADTVATTQWLPLTCHDGSRETGHLVDIACLVQPLKQTVDESEGFLVVIEIHFSFLFSFLWLMNTYNTPQWRERENNGGTWVNWTANNSKISRVCNNPYTNAITTNAHVSVAVYVSRQPTCLVYVFRVAVRETYKSCGCYVVLYVIGCKNTINSTHSDTFWWLSYGLIAFLRLKGWTSSFVFSPWQSLSPPSSARLSTF